MKHYFKHTNYEELINFLVSDRMNITAAVIILHVPTYVCGPENNAMGSTCKTYMHMCS